VRLRFKEFQYFSSEAMGFSNGQRQIRKALERQGVNIVHNAETELQHLSSHLYSKNCKRSFIMPTHEADNIPASLIDKINEADEVIAVCEHNKKVFKDNGVTKKIHLCNQGIDLDIFKYTEHIRKDTLNFLWVGQTSIRKGWDLVISAFNKAFGNMKDVRLYMKTNGKGQQEIIDINNNIVFDSRNLALADMLDLYRDNHIFLFPSRGEATGLPCIESMASGMICLAPSIGGMKEFIDDYSAIPLEYDMVDANYGVKIKVPNVKISDFVDKLRYVYDWYDDIIDHSKIVRKIIEDKCDINSMAQKLVKIIFT